MKSRQTRLVGILTILASTSWIARSADASYVTGSITPTSGETVNLTTLGPLDWVHYGLGGGGDSGDGEPLRDSSGAIIGGLTATVPIKGYANSLNTYTWSNGSPVLSGTNTNGAGMNDPAGVMTLTLAASTTPLQAQFYVGTTGGLPGSFTVALNDGSGASYTAPAFTGYDIITIDYAANSTSTLTMTFTSPGLNGGFFGIGLEAVTIGTAPVPEPTSIALLGLGAAGAVGVARRRRRVRV
jgi:hypothetical protein